MTKDNINPSHYKDLAPIECFDLIVATQGIEAAMNYCVCNAQKYIFRNKGKGGDEDILKAAWYLDKYRELYEIQNPPVDSR